MDDLRVTSSDMRKSNKPLMEKRRRARINKSLNELKQILVESMKKSTPGHSKWEKADILEMTVQYLQCLRNQQTTTKTDPLSTGQFIAGFSECVKQMQKFSSASGDAKMDSQDKLMEFLLSYLKTFSDDATRGFYSHPENSEPPTFGYVSSLNFGPRGAEVRESFGDELSPQSSPTASGCSSGGESSPLSLVGWPMALGGHSRPETAPFPTNSAHSDSYERLRLRPMKGSNLWRPW